MTGRALVFSNPDVIRLLSAAFIPYAGDQWYLHRQEDEDGRYFWQVVQQGHRRDSPRDTTRQGLYIATADGKLLASDHFRPSAPAVLAMMRKVPAAAPGGAAGVAVERSASDRRYHRAPPEGGLIVDVFTRIPQEPGAAEKWTPNHATGRDHLWLTREEARSLRPPAWKNGERYPVPSVIAGRIARFHLTDNVRGEPPMWTRNEVKEAEFWLTVEDAAARRVRLEGSVRLQATSNRGYEARLQGLLTFDGKGERVTGFDALAWGEAWGQGPYTRGAPPGRFPLLIAFAVAGNAAADRVPPQASRDSAGYFNSALR